MFCANITGDKEKVICEMKKQSKIKHDTRVFAEVELNTTYGMKGKQNEIHDNKTLEATIRIHSLNEGQVWRVPYVEDNIAKALARASPTPAPKAKAKARAKATARRNR